MRWPRPLGTEAGGQPEAGEVGAEEGGHLGHAPFAQGQDIKAAGNVRARGVVPQVRAEGELTVGRGGQEAPAGLQRAVAQEGMDLIVAAIPLGSGGME